MTYIKPRVNNHLKEQGKQPVKFVLTDPYPVLDQWEAIAKRQENISYVEKPLDLVKCPRIAARGRKECRMLNASFHHFDDEAAVAVLGAAIQEADAFLYVSHSLSSSKPYLYIY
jgi:salicylate hydroxylase